MGSGTPFWTDVGRFLVFDIDAAVGELVREGKGRIALGFCSIKRLEKGREGVISGEHSQDLLEKVRWNERL